MELEYNITHYELCKKVANHFFKTKRADVALFEYKTMVIPEEPDVLLFKQAKTFLYEIKVSRGDFLSDKSKDCRIKYKIPSYNLWKRKINGAFTYVTSQYETIPKKFYIEKPHLGIERFYVCPHGMIKKEEVPENWGLIWYKNGKFRMIKESGAHRRNIHAEMILLTHAFRKKTGLVDSNIIVKNYVAN